METKFTSGKWERAEGSNIIWAGTKRIAKVHIDPNDESENAGETEEANAALIASAPEMYEALEMIRKAHNSYPGGILTNKELVQVELVLKKALGES